MFFLDVCIHILDCLTVVKILRTLKLYQHGFQNKIHPRDDADQMYFGDQRQSDQTDDVQRRLSE